MDEHDFERMMGREPEPDEPPEERAAREARLGTPEATLGDLFHPDNLDRYFDDMGQRRQAILDHFGLRDPATEEDGPSAEDFYEMLSEAQRVQYEKANSYYLSKRLAIEGEHGSLVAFAATNPPAVLRRHLWRLQRKLDKPLFGEDPREFPPTQVREYRATLMVTLCDRCADELRDESEAEREPDAEESKPMHQTHSMRFHLMDKGDLIGTPLGRFDRYLFRLGDTYVEREVTTSLFGDDEFPYASSKECQRCGTTDVDMWRERYGDK